MRHILLFTMLTLAGPIAVHAQTPAQKLAAAILRADYEGDRVALDRLYNELKAVRPADGSRRQAARLRYWLGFAKWRRTINGFNVNADPAELEKDLNIAVSEFDASRAADPSFADAAVGMLGSLQNLMFIHRDNKAKSGEFAQRFITLFKETMKADPDNPRLAWLDGGGKFYMAQFAPAEERAKQQAAGVATYKRGLENIRKQKRPASSLEPSWGEPELLMSLAWTSLNQDTPDVAAAEKYATEALALVPHWHYLKDILIPQIRAKVP